MDWSDISSSILMNLAGDAPYLAAWIAAVVLSVIMLRRGGGRAERFLVAGSSVMLAKQILEIPASVSTHLLIMPWLLERGWEMSRAMMVFSYISMFFGLVGMAGIVCLVWAFWIKFRVKANGTA